MPPDKTPAPTSCALVLLAAGGSTRMGRPKQLLPIDGKPLLRRVVDAALNAPVDPVIVVLGANASEITPCLDGLRVHPIVNEAWADGMGSSLRAGVTALGSLTPRANAVVVALADQPDFPIAHVTALIETHRRTGRGIVATEIAGVLQPPALFAAKYFPALRALTGDAGARALFKTHAADVAAVPLAALRDLDSPGDYEKFLAEGL